MKRRDVLKGLAALVAVGPAVAEAATRAPAPVASESGFAVAAALGQYDHLGGGERYITERYITPGMLDPNIGPLEMPSMSWDNVYRNAEQIEVIAPIPNNSLFAYRDPGDEMRGSVSSLDGTVCGSDGVPIGNLEQQDIFSFRLRLTPDGWEDVSGA